MAESASAASHSARQARSSAAVRSRPLAVAELDHRPGVQAPRPGGDVLALLVATAGDVVGEQPPEPSAEVVAGEDRDDAQAHHRGLEVAADHHRELVGLALEAERGAFDLLVVLELELEQPHHLHRRPRGAGDRDRAVAVGLDHLLHRPMADQVARGRPAVAGHHHPVGEAQRDAGGGVRDRGEGPWRRPGTRAGRAGAAQQFREARPRVVTRGEERHAHEPRAPMRASERQRASGHRRPAWPGNAMNGMLTSRVLGERASASERAALRPAWPGNAMNGIAIDAYCPPFWT